MRLKVKLTNQDGVWLPKLDNHFTKKYQSGKLKSVLKYVTNWNVCLDIGAHCGLWTMPLVRRFREVHAFEPIVPMVTALKMNAPEARIYTCALGEENKIVFLRWDDTCTGGTKILDEIPDGYVKVEADMKKLDDFNIENIGFIKIDVEGYERQVLEGGEETIMRSKPVIIVEQKSNKDALPWLLDRGYKQVKVIAGDYIMVHDFCIDA